MIIPPPPLSILVVDDDPLVRDAIETVLLASFEDAHVTIERDGADGLERCTTQQFDVIVTDNRMPRLTGVEMLFEARAHGIRTPAILASGSGAPPGDLTRARPFLFVPKTELYRIPQLIPTLVTRPFYRRGAHHDPRTMRLAS